MGILRNLAKVFLSTFFLMSLTIFTFLLLLTRITEYSTLKRITLPLIESQINVTEGQKIEILNYLKYRCLNEKEVNIEIGKNITISCEDINTLNEENITYYFVNKIFDTFYFENYECKLQECLKDRKLEYFLSLDFHKNISQLSKYFLIAAIAFGLLYLISIETLESRILSLGIIFVLTAVPYFIIDYSALLIPEPKEGLQMRTIMIQIFKEQASFLLYFLIVGIVLLLVYFVLVVRKRCLLTKYNKKYVAGKRRNE